MKTKSIILAGLSTMMLASCGTVGPTFTEAFTPEESALNLVKITDESNNSVVSGVITTYYGNYALSTQGYSGENRFSWSTTRALDISKDGNKLAYITSLNKQHNIMVRSTSAQGLATQRTFRNVGSFCWGDDNQLYFTDYAGENSFISSVSAEKGNMMRQLTNGSVNDLNPAITSDGELLFFTRMDSKGPAIWSLNRKDGTLTSCARGYNCCVIPGVKDAFYCVRNNTNGRSEIWFVNFVNGEETLVASDVNHSFTNPELSPDGKWIVMVGNSKYKGMSNNLDIFVVKTDGTNLTQLTYHPETDNSPIWSHDGRSIFFLSTRANKDRFYNVWRMNFNIE